jgi:PAS domain S-box-containing protein
LKDLMVDIKRDINERTHIEDILRKEKAFNESVLNSLQDIMYVIDLNGRFLKWNKSLSAITGYSDKEISRKKPTDFFMGEDVQCISNAIEMVVKTGTASIAAELVTKNGGRINYEFNGTLLKDYDGEPLGICGIGRNINERKRTEIVLKENEKRLSEAQRITHIGNWEWNIKTNELYWSEENYRIFGLSRDIRPSVEAFLNTVHPDDLKLVQKSMDDALHGKPYDIDMHIIRPDGQERIVNAKADVCFDGENNPIKMSGTVQDITERKHAEERLNLFRYLIDKSNDAITIVNSETGIILDANEKASSSLGYTTDELLNMHVFDFEATLPDTFSWKKHVEEVKKKGSLILEGLHRRKDGTTFPSEVNVKFIEIENKYRFVAIARDITERKQADREKDRFLKAFANSNDGIIISDEKDQYIYLNEAYSKICGYSEEELIGETWRKLIAPELIAATELELDRTIHDINVNMLNGESPILRKDGTTIPIDVRGKGIWDENGNYQGHICIVRDITEHKRIVEKVKESEERFHSITQSANDAIITADSNGKIIFWNNGAQKLFGYKDEEVTGKQLTFLMPERYRDAHQTGMERFFATGVPHVIGKTVELSCLRKDGSEFLIELSLSTWKTRDKVFYSGILRDITERKLAEEKIRKSLEEKEVLLREIHHRVKNNMQIISSLLMLQSQNIEDKKYKDMFIDSQTRIYSMALIHEKLYQSESIAQINLKEYIDGIVSNIFESYRVKGNTKIDINIENIPLKIDYAVPCGLIINELVTNSLKYAFPDERQGKIQIILKSDYTTNNIQLSISDDGIGIPKELDIRNTKSLGLHLVTALAERQLHGKIILNRDNGTEFQISFNAK